MFVATGARAPDGYYRAARAHAHLRVMRQWLARGWLILGLSLCGYALTRQPLGSIADACRAMGPLVFVAPLVASIWLVTRTNALAIVLGGTVPWRDLLQLRWIGDGYNALLPMAGIGGEPFKLRELTQGLAVDHALTGLVRDRMIDNGAGLLFSAAGLAVALPGIAVPTAAHDALWAYVVVATLVGLAVLGLLVTRLPGRFGAMAGRRLVGRGHEASPLGRASMSRALAWALATRLLQACETALLLRCIGVPFAFTTVVFVDGALNAAGFLGFMLPQGLGVVEGTAVFLLTALGAPPAAATAFALARRGRILLVGLIGVALHVSAKGREWLARSRGEHRVEAFDVNPIVAGVGREEVPNARSFASPG